MLFDQNYQPVDEVAHGFAPAPVPAALCQVLVHSAARAPAGTQLTVVSGGQKAHAVRTADGMLRVAMDGTVEENRTAGPGTELKKLLASLFIKASPTCGCNKMAKEMDRLGPEWCLANIEKIVDVMAAEAAKRKLPFVRPAARALVRLAVRRARR